jgi:glycine cleavage system H lipoate-binding protein
VTIGELVWQIKGDTSDIDKNVARTETRMEKFGKAVTTAFSVAALVTFGKKLFDVAKSSILATADLAESANAVSVVFGDAADIIDSFGDDSVRAVGLTKTAFNELSTIVGAQLKQSGLEIDVVADKTIELTRRAADTASIFNVDVNESLQAFGAALRGESEPARRFGVNLSDAAVQAEALASGLVESKDQITDQIKVQARYNLIMQQSADYADDFANTQDSFSNQTKIARANIEELQAAIGEGLIPVANTLVISFNEIIEKLIETKKRANELNDAIRAQREGEASLEQQLAILVNRRERYTGLTRRQKEALDEEIASLRRLIEIQANSRARAEDFADGQEAAANATNEAGEAAEGATDSIEGETEAIEDQIRALQELARIQEEKAERALERIKEQEIARREAIEAEREDEAEILRQVKESIREQVEREIEKAEEFARIQEELAEAEASALAEKQLLLDEAAIIELERDIAKRAARKANAKAEADAEIAEIERVKQARISSSQYAVTLASTTFGNLAALYDKDSKERRRLLIAQAVADRATASYSNFINTKEAATKALTAGPIIGPILAGIITAAGIANGIAILARPLPKLQDGAIIQPRPGGTEFIAGEQGRAEAVVPLDSGNGFGTLNLTLILPDETITLPVQRALDNRDIVVNVGSIGQ